MIIITLCDKHNNNNIWFVHVSTVEYVLAVVQKPCIKWSVGEMSNFYHISCMYMYVYVIALHKMVAM